MTCSNKLIIYHKLKIIIDKLDLIPLLKIIENKQYLIKNKIDIYRLGDSDFLCKNLLSNIDNKLNELFNLLENKQLQDIINNIEELRKIIKQNE